jgi:hypothetical protein
MRFIRIIAVSVLMIASQNALPPQRAEANILSDIAAAVAGNYVYDLGKTACGFRCAFVSTAVTVVAVHYAPAVTEKAVEYAKPGLFDMFTRWGSTFFRP